MTRPCTLAASLVALALAWLPAVAVAAPDTFLAGTGRDGSRVVAGGDSVVNAYTRVTADVSSGDTEIAVADESIVADGDLVLIWQTVGLAAQVPGDPGPVDLRQASVGRWELARVSTTAALSVTLTAPMVRGYAADMTQMVRVPEYTTVTVQNSGRIIAAPWDPATNTGGIVAFFANGAITLTGDVDASGAGFRGGLAVNDASAASGCSTESEAAPVGAQRGEGLSSEYGASSTGRGNLGSGGGGGVCVNSGGGGGGNGGIGGDGGRSEDGARLVGGLGGAALIAGTALERMTLGGGGGAGHIDDGWTSSIGHGGGAVLIRGQTLGGSGRILADGEDAGGAVADGAAGGGAGGSVIVQLTSSGTCDVSATGGSGGPVDDDAGSGGGGGGGRVFLQADTGSSCPTDVSGGVSGENLSADPLGAQNGTDGALVISAAGPLGLDSDGDLVPDSAELDADTDSDETMDVFDPDDDGDGIPTGDEQPAHGTGDAADWDGDVVPH
ncbi:MAG: hypothetical protein OXT09_12995 [Myxococcales bacterium]|nr:hypothetical protein [Myxococcales bacterium]